jgi:hypothetical protein
MSRDATHRRRFLRTCGAAALSSIGLAGASSARSEQTTITVSGDSAAPTNYTIQLAPPEYETGPVDVEGSKLGPNDDIEEGYTATTIDGRMVAGEDIYSYEKGSAMIDLLVVEGEGSISFDISNPYEGTDRLKRTVVVRSSAKNRVPIQEYSFSLQSGTLSEAALDDLYSDLENGNGVTGNPDEMDTDWISGSFAAGQLTATGTDTDSDEYFTDGQGFRSLSFSPAGRDIILKHS